MSINAAELSPAELAKYIDHTLLKPEASREQVLAVAAEAIEYGFASVCINPVWVSTVAEALAGSDVKTCTVIGFALGATTTAAKAFEATVAADQGADELDMVIDIAAARAGDRARLVEDIRAVAEVAHAKGKLLKVIIETSLLDHDAKVLACQASVEAGADFVKTSTGFNGGGATVADVELMRATVGPDLGVKASGGVRSYEDAVALINAGATRIGASSGVAIVSGGASNASY
ncbi:deoxyribose-phosphate aldolase [Galactobacter caseinivorans]|uniref:Deoxyribose-phosphate aldolase n=1 Tax=Galactobacter caseinivorans TaxID=2676123 RepID=A0A496PJK2_9MICC|nr:deoxyribose-phosphate aldolase [Galactobacter caseinivorans]RKW70674.1 deoxyribose-phosphate aldolase [Galactobacter caseinivorans]